MRQISVVGWPSAAYLNAAGLTTCIAAVFVAIKAYHAALAAGTIARYAADAALGAPLLAAARGRRRIADLLAAAAWGGEADG
jgi:hypothetical protein